MAGFERKFQVWEYWISHSQLLLRSHKTVTHAQNIDIIFIDVKYIELPTFMTDLEVTAPSAEDYMKAEQAMGRPVPAERVFAILANGRRHLIVAGRMDVFENELELFQPCLTHF